jgi:hypothetical protein
MWGPLLAQQMSGDDGGSRRKLHQATRGNRLGSGVSKILDLKFQTETHPKIGQPGAGSGGGNPAAGGGSTRLMRRHHRHLCNRPACSALGLLQATSRGMIFVSIGPLHGLEKSTCRRPDQVFCIFRCSNASGAPATLPLVELSPCCNPRCRAWLSPAGRSLVTCRALRFPPGHRRRPRDICSLGLCFLRGNRARMASSRSNSTRRFTGDAGELRSGYVPRREHRRHRRLAG